MYDFFYNFYKRETADGLYRKYSSEGTPPTPPPFSQERITEDGTVRITEDGQIRITE